MGFFEKHFTEKRACITCGGLYPLFWPKSWSRDMDSPLVIPTNFYSGFFYFHMWQKFFLGFLLFSHFLYRIFDLVIFFSLPSNPFQQPITQPNNQSPSLANDPPTTSQHCFSFSVNRYVLTAGSFKYDYFFDSKIIIAS